MRTINVLQFICPSGFYGAEMWILALARHLNPERVNCRLVITREGENRSLELYERFRDLGLKADQIAMADRFDPRAIVRLSRFIRREKIDLIHTHGYKSDILGLLAARLTGIKSIATPHGFENSPDRKLQFYIRIGCQALRRIDRVAPLSTEIESDLRGLKVSPGKIRLIMNGVDLSEIDRERGQERPPSWPGHERKIGYVGQIAHRKNVRDLIETFDLLYREHKNVRLVVVGDGPQRAMLEDLAARLPSFSRIEFLGYRADRLALLKQFSLFTMTSSLEGIPRCMMEAMAMEVPVAAYNIPGVDRLIIPEKTGLLAGFGDKEGLKRCWERILSDEEFAAGMAKAARAHIVEKFSAKRMAKEYTELYEEMVTPAVRQTAMNSQEHPADR